MRKAPAEYVKTACEDGIRYKGIESWVRVKTQMKTRSCDELTQYWAQMLWYLNDNEAYFFAVQSGNWKLRNSSLKKITELFFAYSHNKYEYLYAIL